MNNSEELFHQIASKTPNATVGKMFGALSIKTKNGKTAAFLWKGNMVFKLDEDSQQLALKLEGASIGSHIYAPDKQMKGWISLPEKQLERWLEFAKKAVHFTGSLSKNEN